MIVASARSRGILLTLLSVAVVSPASAAPSLARSLTGCELPGLDRPARCGSFEVAEDPRKPAGRRIALRFAVLPARGGAPLPEPVVYLAGGPGLGALGSAALFGDGFTALQERHEVVLVDLRGTGGSGALRCDWESPAQAAGALLAGEFEASWLHRCLERLDADPRFYTTPLAADDLDRLLEALGYPRVHLLAASFGTRVALEVLRRHPDRVATATLRAASPGFKLLHRVGDGAAAALQAAFDRCAASVECRSAVPDPPGDFAALLARLDEEPVPLAVPGPGGTRVELALDRELFAGIVFRMLYDRAFADRLPRLVRATLDGDARELGELAVRLAGGIAGLDVGAYLSVVCSEDVPFASVEPSRGEGWHDFLGTRISSRLEAACRVWPRGTVPADFKRPVSAPTPVLLLSGALDPTTPPGLGERAAATLPASTHMVDRELSHLPTWTGCFADAVARFVALGALPELSASCSDRVVVIRRGGSGPTAAASEDVQ